MDNETIIKILTETAERAKSNTYQIEELKEEVKDLNKEQKAIYDIASSIKVMSSEMVNIRGDITAVKDSQEQFAEKVKDNQKELTDKIDSIEQKPYKDWTKVKSTIITGVATAVGTGAIIYLINFLFNTNL